MTSEKEQFYIQRIAELEAQLKQRDERIAELEKQVAELMEQVGKLTDKVAKLSKNSSNSSKPPSSDIVRSFTTHRCQPISKKGNWQGRKHIIDDKAEIVFNELRK